MSEPPATEVDCRPEVALPPSGPPLWSLAAGAVAVGGAVLLALNGQGAGASARSAQRSYAGPAVPQLPRSLDRSPGDLLGLGEGDARASYAPAYATPEVAPLPFGRAADPSDRPSWASTPSYPPPAAFGARSARPSSEGNGQMAFPSQPMPGGLGTSGAGGGMRAMGAPGSAVVFDSGPPGAGGFGDKAMADGSAARASLIRNRAAVVAQGEVLAATLETPVNSTRPGPIRAVISRDVRGFDGSRVLIPRGSRLIGEYRADPQSSRRRILATWTRLIRPDGVAIRIDSPAADAMGGTGLPGRVDTHFLARFANAALQSALQIGVNLASRAGSGSVIVSNTPQISSSLGQSLVPGADEPPTVSVRAGTAVSVFVARDLDFAGVPVLR